MASHATEFVHYIFLVDCASLDVLVSLCSFKRIVSFPVLIFL